MKLVFRPRAIGDLSDIWDYTADRWSPRQADTYVRQLEEACQRLSETPNMGRDVNHIREGYRAWPTGSHVVFGHKVDNQFVVERILHKHQCASLHLSDKS